MAAERSESTNQCSRLVRSARDRCMLPRHASRGGCEFRVAMDLECRGPTNGAPLPCRSGESATCATIVENVVRDLARSAVDRYPLPP